MQEHTDAPTLRRLWAEGEKGRQSWALDAYERFCTELSDWTRDQLPETRNETTIALFGPTKVGKTTLLLELLGVAQSSFEGVDKVLRGGRGAESSSTAMPMVYLESADEYWRLDQGRALDDDGMKEELADIRSRVETKKLTDPRVATLHIPKQYFGTARHGLPRVRILDLPGVEAANANEAEFVHTVVQKYVPTADLVLLITSADNLGFLHPENLTASGLRALDWTISPNRFCVVTSYAFKLETVQNWIEAPGKTRDVTALRNRFAEQMRTFGIQVADPNCLFPLDFGDSWKEAPAKRRALATPLMEKLRAELLQRITKAADPLGRLHHASDAIRIAVKLEQAALADHVRKQDAAGEDMRQRAALLKNWRQQRTQRNARLDALLDAGSVASTCQELRQEFNKKLEHMPQRLPAADDTNAMKKSQLLSAAWRYQADLWYCVSNLEALVPETEPDHAHEILKLMAEEFEEKKFFKRAATFFASFNQHIDNPIIDSYWRLVPGRRFAEDRAQLAGCMEKACTWLRSYFDEACDKAAWAHQTVLKRDQTRMKRALQRVQARIERLETEQTQQQAAMAKLAEETAGIKRVLAGDKERAEAFNELLRAALHDDLRARRDTLIREPVPVRRFLQLVEAVAVCDRAQNLFPTAPAKKQEIQ
jgi:hypothetical protein